MNYLGCENSKQFNRKYRGLKTVCHGLVPRNDRPGYIESTSLEPISDKANTIQYYASQAYHGGYNASSDIGYFSQITFDYDLQNAYPRWTLQMLKSCQSMWLMLARSMQSP